MFMPVGPLLGGSWGIGTTHIWLISQLTAGVSYVRPDSKAASRLLGHLQVVPQATGFSVRHLHRITHERMRYKVPKHYQKGHAEQEPAKRTSVYQGLSLVSCSMPAWRNL